MSYLVHVTFIGYVLRYTGACRLVHGFTCAGVLPTQYTKFARFSGIGSVGHGYIRQGNCHAYVLVIFIIIIQ